MASSTAWVTPLSSCRFDDHRLRLAGDLALRDRGEVLDATFDLLADRVRVQLGE